MVAVESLTGFDHLENSLTGGRITGLFGTCRYRIYRSTGHFSQRRSQEAFIKKALLSR